MNYSESVLVGELNRSDVRRAAQALSEISLELGQQPFVLGAFEALVDQITRFMADAQTHQELECILLLPGGKASLILSKRDNNAYLTLHKGSWRLGEIWVSKEFTGQHGYPIERWTQKTDINPEEGPYLIAVVNRIIREYVATCVEVPLSGKQGKTEEEALQNLVTAVRQHMQDHPRSFPAPVSPAAFRLIRIYEPTS